jgi:hypothetical protein
MNTGYTIPTFQKTFPASILPSEGRNLEEYEKMPVLPKGWGLQAFPPLYYRACALSLIPVPANKKEIGISPHPFSENPRCSSHVTGGFLFSLNPARLYMHTPYL